MTEVFLERRFETALSADDVVQMASAAAGCFEAHRVDWRNSLLGSGGRQMVCWFGSVDAEATRTALRQADADIRVIWPGTLHDAPGREGVVPNVMVERRFADPVRLQDIQAIEDAGAWCLETHRVMFVRTFFSLDRQRMLCLYRAPDSESVRLAQREAGMPMDAVWSFQPVLPFL
jgi:hypothetical protein